MKTSSISSAHPRTVWAAIATIVVVLAVFMVWGSLRSANSMSAATSSDAQSPAQAPEGTTVKFVLEVADATPTGLIHGKLLEKQTEKVYLRTATAMTVHSSENTKLVMGKQTDVHAAAVLHVTGAVQSDHSIAAEQIVILTGYVELK
jgi:hypothetical protein